MADSTSERQGTIAGRSEFNIYYEDTDFSGFVYHANYLKFFERAREHLIGSDALKRWYGSGIQFVVAKVSLDFHAPARYGDLISIESRGDFSRSPRFPFQQVAWLMVEGRPVKKLVTGLIDIVAIGGNFRPLRLSDELIDYLEGRNRK